MQGVDVSLSPADLNSILLEIFAETNSVMNSSEGIR